MEKKVSAVITGIHRGGTTWFGSLFNCLESVSVIHEPFNYNHGIVGVPRWYLGPTDEEFLFSSLEKISSGNAVFKRPFLKHAALRSVAKMILGSGAEAIYNNSMASSSSELYLKDPFLIKTTGKLISKGIKVIVIVRHPAAVFQSLKRLEWQNSLKNLVFNTDNLPRFETPLGAEHYMAKLWNELYSDLSKCADSVDSNNLFLINHEAFFSDVHKNCMKLFRFLELESHIEQMLAYGLETTSAKVVTPSGRDVHVLSRNSQELKNSWRLSISNESLSVFETECGGLYRKILESCDI